MSFKNVDGRKIHKEYYLPTVKIKDYNAIVGGKHFFDQPIKSDLRTCDNVGKISTYDYKPGCLLDYPYFKKYYKLVAIDLSKQQKLDADSKAIQQINFTGNLDRAEGSTTFFIIEEAKKEF